MELLYLLNTAVLSMLTVVWCLLMAGQITYVLSLHRRRIEQPDVLQLAFEWALFIHLVLNAILTRMAFSGPEAQIAMLSVVRVSIQDLMWLNIAVFALGIASAVRTMQASTVFEAWLVVLSAPPVFSALGAWWLGAYCVGCSYFLFRVCVSHVSARRHRAEALMKTAPLDAIRGILEGVLLFDGSGQIRYENDFMRDLLADLGIAGDLSDGRKIWPALLDVASEPKAAGQLVIGASDGREYLFSPHKADSIYGYSACIIAVDVTEEQAVNRAHESQNYELEVAQRNLREAIDNVRSAADNEALLSVRSRVHDLLGQRLSILHRHLSDGIDLGSSWETLRNLVETTDLKTDGFGGLTHEEALQAIIDSFAFAGVSLTVDGELPEDDQIADAFVRVIREATTNATLHGGAFHVNAAIARECNRIVLVVCNDGVTAQVPLCERGGFASMRNAACEAGGYLEWVSEPWFEVRVIIPQEEGR